MSSERKAQEAARALLLREIPENTLKGFNADLGLTLGVGSRFIDALRAAWIKKAAAGDPDAEKAADLLKAYDWLE